MARTAPGSVCIIDFDGVTPDAETEIVPSSLNRVSWNKLLSVALDDLSNDIAPSVVVICEGSSLGRGRQNFDAEVYDKVLASRVPGLLFISGGASTQVSASGLTVRDGLSRVLPRVRVVALADRDSKSDAEVQGFENGGDIVLPVRNLESYLLADDVLEALVNSVGKPQLFTDAKRVRDDALAASVGRGNATDDLKSAAGETYVGLRALLALNRSGNSADAFMRDTLAPLVKPDMPTYDAMFAAIVARLGL